MQLEDAQTHTLLWENFNVVMLKNGVPKVNLKGFMVDSAHANWIDVRKVHKDGHPTSFGVV